jgi:hypothetical protein
MADEYWMSSVEKAYCSFLRSLEYGGTRIAGISFMTGINYGWPSICRPKITKVYYLQFESYLKDKERIDSRTGQIFKYQERDIYYIGKLYNRKEACSWIKFYREMYQRVCPDLFENFIVIDSEEKEYYDWSRWAGPGYPSFDAMI